MTTCRCSVHFSAFLQVKHTNTLTDLLKMHRFEKRVHPDMIKSQNLLHRKNKNVSFEPRENAVSASLTDFKGVVTERFFLISHSYSSMHAMLARLFHDPVRLRQLCTHFYKVPVQAAVVSAQSIGL